MPPSSRQAVQRPEYGETDEPIARWIESLAASPRIASPPRAGRINLDELARSTDEQGRLKRATIISFTPGKPIYVDAWINDSARARLLLGTGADHTLIAPRLLSAAGVSLRAPRTTAEIRG